MINGLHSVNFKFKDKFPELHVTNTIFRGYICWVCSHMHTGVSVWFSFVGLYAISTIVGYLMPNPFYTYKQFYFKHFSSVKEHNLHVKNSSISTIRFSITILFKCQKQFFFKQFSLAYIQFLFTPS